MKRNTLLILAIFLVFLISCKGKTPQKEVLTAEAKVSFTDSTDQAIFNSIKEIAATRFFSKLQQDERLLELAKIFLQTPYVGGTLETEGNEKLVVNLRELDCTTYLENVLVLSSIANRENFNESDFLTKLEEYRYREGKITDYSSRLHYFSDWLFENEKKGLIQNITEQIGGENYEKEINFMTNHVDAYSALSTDSSLIDKIKEVENQINQRDLYYIPEANVQKLEDKIKSGDLIAITTKIKGLDVSHVGIAIYVNNRLHLIHASTKAKKVVISDIPLADMLLKNKLQTGIMVARVI